MKPCMYNFSTLLDVKIYLVIMQLVLVRNVKKCLLVVHLAHEVVDNKLRQSAS